MLTANGMRRVKRIAKIAAKSFLVLLILAIILIVATPQGRTGSRAAMFVMQVIPAIPVKPLTWFTGDPERRPIQFDGAVGQLEADLYIPDGEGPFDAVLLFLGVNPAGRDDSRVVNLADGLARTGRVVMIPWSDDMAAKRIVPGEIDNLVLAFEHLAGLDFVDPDRVGMAGFCVGASLAAVAAADPRISDRVRYVNFFGGYFDAADLVKSVVTRSRSYDGVVEAWDPDALAVEVVRLHLIEGLSDPAERELLETTFLRGDSVTRSEVDSLSVEGTAVFDLLLGPEPDEVDEIFERLPSAVHESLRRISPSTGIDRLNARLLIMHDREDNLVPSYESRRLFDVVDDRGNTYYTEFSFFSHVDPTEQVGFTGYITEGFKLFLHLYNMFRTF
jgi:hypothetical protein